MNRQFREFILGGPTNQDFFPPMSRAEMDRLGWEQCDVILVTGDAYVDHPSFGTAIIARVLIDAGFRTGIVAEPRWDSADDFRQLGKPRLFFGVTAGNVDSMVNHYSPLGQRRRADAYSPGGKAGRRPNRATIVYANRLHEAFPGVPLVLGGIEASLRRLAHYDYWDNAVRRSILLDARADIIAYGMAEPAVIEIAQRLADGIGLEGIRGTVVARKTLDGRDGFQEVPSFEEVKADKTMFGEAFRIWYQESDQPKGKTIVQKSGDRYVVQHPPAMPLSQSELDRIYDLPYARRPHPAYAALGRIPALETTKFSITSHRGCPGSCSFCSLAAHQGRIIQWRSRQSIVAEAEKISRLPDFKGHITDVGGPTANMYAVTCAGLARAEPCRERSCLFPNRCPSLKSDLHQQLRVLDAVRQVPGVRKVSIGTGLRYDLLDSDGSELEELCRYYVSGQLRVAPEHSSRRVLRLMRKTSPETYLRFTRQFRAVNRRLGKEQHLVPYFISGFPGCTLEDMIGLAEQIEQVSRLHVAPALVRQVQDFTPLPMTLAALMYYTERDPATGEKLYVAKDIKDKKLQRAMLQLRDPKNYQYVRRILKQTGQMRLLGRVDRLGRKTGGHDSEGGLAHLVSPSEAQ